MSDGVQATAHNAEVLGFTATEPVTVVAGDAASRRMQ